MGIRIKGRVFRTILWIIVYIYLHITSYATFMKPVLRHAIWLIDNIKFSGNDFTKELIVDGEKIEFLITNYENSKKLGYPFDDWIHNKIVNMGMRNSMNSPLPINCVFVIAMTPYKGDNAGLISLLMKLCLKLVYYPPSLVSHTAEYSENVWISLPTWNGWKNQHPVSENEINSESFDLVINYFNELSATNKSYHKALEQIYNIANINDILIELLSLWSFIEGFWNTNSGDSKLDQSFLNMLTTDFEPGKLKRDPEIRVVTQQILSQNEKIGARTYSELRNILAHGQFLNLTDSWTSEQWKAIREQRNLLIETTVKALVHYTKNVA